MLPALNTVVSLVPDAEGVPGASFRDAENNEFRLVIPASGEPVLQRFVPHRFTDKFTGDHHVYGTREDTPLAWEDAARLLDDSFLKVSPDQHEARRALVRALAVRAEAETGLRSDPSLHALLRSISDVMFPADEGDRLVSIDSRALDGDSPLHVLLWRRDEVGAQRLIDAGADVDAVGDMSETPLHVALRLGLSDVVERLLAARANPDIRSEFDKTSRELAYELGGQMADCFRRAGIGPPFASPIQTDTP
jgi:hypothetical protein